MPNARDLPLVSCEAVTTAADALPSPSDPKVPSLTLQGKRRAQLSPYPRPFPYPRHSLGTLRAIIDDYSPGSRGRCSLICASWRAALPLLHTTWGSRRRTHARSTLYERTHQRVLKHVLPFRGHERHARVRAHLRRARCSRSTNYWGVRCAGPPARPPPARRRRGQVGSVPADAPVI
jgi:hypothetical protein